MAVVFETSPEMVELALREEGLEPYKFAETAWLFAVKDEHGETANVTMLMGFSEDEGANFFLIFANLDCTIPPKSLPRPTLVAVLNAQSVGILTRAEYIGDDSPGWYALTELEAEAFSGPRLARRVRETAELAIRLNAILPAG